MYVHWCKQCHQVYYCVRQSPAGNANDMFLPIQDKRCFFSSSCCCCYMRAASHRHMCMLHISSRPQSISFSFLFRPSNRFKRTHSAWFNTLWDVHAVGYFQLSSYYRKNNNKIKTLFPERIYIKQEEIMTAEAYYELLGLENLTSSHSYCSCNCCWRESPCVYCPPTMMMMMVLVVVVIMPWSANSDNSPSLMFLSFSWLYTFLELTAEYF